MSIQPLLIAAAALFSIGIYGILVRRNAVMVLLSIELILNSVNINFVAFNAMLSDVFLNGQIFSIFIISPFAGYISTFKSILESNSLVHGPAQIIKLP